MQIAYSLEKQLTNKATLLTIGKFDGFHKGHQLLIQTAVEQAQRCKCCSAVLTFDPHPDQVIHPERDIRLLTTLDERIELIATFNPDILIVLPFTPALMNTTAEAFMRQVCAALPLRELWVGANFSVGYRREGNISRLIEIGEQLNYSVGSVAPLLVEGAPVSSSRVRSLLRDGVVEGVEALLGRRFSVRGVVVRGDRRGHTIGYPTANLALNPIHALPAHGVYACYATIETLPQRLPAIVNIGVRPTFAGSHPTVEAHLLDWDGNLYGQKIQLSFWYRLRGEQRFGGIDELREQIRRDEAQARELFRYAA